MAANASFVGSIFKKFKPHILMVLAQLGYTILYVITEAAFSHGMNPHVYVTYRHIVSAIFMLPFAYFLEGKIKPKLTLALFLEINILSLLGLTLNMYFASLKYTSSTFVSSVVNMIAALTFLIAVSLRLEEFDFRNPRGIAKVLGTLLSLAGVTIMTLYKGPKIENLWHPLVHIQGLGYTTIHEERMKGSALSVASCITWSIWFIMQAFTLERYPARLSLTTWMSFFGATQSAIFTVIVEHKPDAWRIGFNIDLWSIIYGGLVISGAVVFIQLWCTEEKGPVFVTMFNPLAAVLVAFLAYFVLGEKLHMGGIIGAVIVIVGLYLLLWGKEGDPVHTTENNPDLQKTISAEGEP